MTRYIRWHYLANHLVELHSATQCHGYLLFGWNGRGCVSSRYDWNGVLALRVPWKQLCVIMSHYFTMWWMCRSQLVHKSSLEVLSIWCFEGVRPLVSASWISEQQPLIIQGNLPTHMTIGMRATGELETYPQKLSFPMKCFIVCCTVYCAVSVIQCLKFPPQSLICEGATLWCRLGLTASYWKCSVKVHCILHA